MCVCLNVCKCVYLQNLEVWAFCVISNLYSISPIIITVFYEKTFTPRLLDFDCTAKPPFEFVLLNFK